MNEEPPVDYSGLLRPKIPSSDLWPGIEARLQPRQPRRWPQLAVAASIALVTILGLSLHQGQQEQASTSKPTPSTASSDSASVLAYASARQEITKYNQRVDTLHSEWRPPSAPRFYTAVNPVHDGRGRYAGHSGLAVKARQQIEVELGLAEEALAEMRKALAENPANESFALMLDDLEAQRADLLRRLKRLPH